MDSVRHWISSIEDGVKRVLRRARARWRTVDHLGRAYIRFRDQRGDRMAAALSFYGFLSFFPLVALAYAVTGYAVAISPHARDSVAQAIDQILPELSRRLPVDQIAQAKAGASVFALLGLAWSGLGWIGVWRESLRTIWQGADGEGNAVVNRLRDLGVLCLLGLALLASVVLSSAASSATHAVLGWVGLGDVPGAGTLLRLIALSVAIVADGLIFFILFTTLAGTKATWRQLLRGCLFGAVGFEVLKLVGALFIAHTVHNPVYASFAVIAGLVVWIYLSSRFILFTAAWTATRRVILQADATDAEAEAEEKDADAAES
ncbi:YihY/virulence factor BrkB family protein [Actinomadura sp. DC4]|uniref:YihY/virulence factor BrkB family protein n=1 Tax=Actinomadura sp. DC4 TaxID=3055069 RepID=UPI0025B0C03A|nr:YihY/virulence factor BrkB family protein [Actinomadura sp. DC4]MDN3357112.1 YihY/virulence factor BrkB family protein [Actinomadura sp. DC4]